MTDMEAVRKRAQAAAAKAKESKAKKRSAIQWKIGDAVKTKTEGKRPSNKFYGSFGEVCGINGEDREVQVKTNVGKGWFYPEDLYLDEDPIISDDDEVFELDEDDDDDFFEEEE